MHKNTYGKRTIRYPRIIFVLFLLLVVVGGGIYFFIQNQDEYAMYRETKGDKDAGKLQEKISDEELPAAFLYYPTFDIAQLDEAILAQVHELEEEKQGEVIIKMDYTSNEVLNQFINVTLTSYTYENEKEISQKQTYFSYDKVQNKMLEISDVLRGNYVQLLSTLAKDVTYTKDTLDKFHIGKESLIVYSDGKEKLFSFEDLKDNMLLNNEGIVKTAPTNINTSSPQVIDPNKPMVAFTFDDGPNPSTTTRILNAFDAVGGRATFFMLGSRAQEFPETVQEVCRRGFEVANHSFSHQNLASDDTAMIYQEIFDTQDVIYKACGTESTLIRPPYGEINDNLRNASDMPLILWNVDTEDWKNRDAAVITARINASIRDGSIILLHDIYDFSAAAIEGILANLQAQGYQFVTISDLMKYRPNEF